MVYCQYCGQSNAQAGNFCRFCGKQMTAAESAPAPVPPPLTPPPAPYYPPVPEPFPVNYEEAPPRPYSWKTDEFQVSDDRNAKNRPADRARPLPPAAPPAPLANYQNAMPQPGNYQCPHCGSRLYPRITRQISTAGWIVFAVLLLTFFPLFWIGFLIKEEARVCPVCNLKVGVNGGRA